MKKIRKQLTTKKHKFNTQKLHNKRILIPLLILSLIFLLSFTLGSVSAATDGSDVIYVTTGNSTSNITEQTEKNQTDTSNTSQNNNSNTKSNNSGQTLPDPSIIRGGTITNYATIQEALNNAQTGDIIRLDYGATFNEHDLNIPAGVTNLTLDVWNSTHTGPGGYATIDAQGLGRILLINSGVTVTIYNINFTNGDGYVIQGSGGAIRNIGTLTLNNCTFTNNKASVGGAILSITGNLTVINCTFINNQADLNGGAIDNNTNSTCTITGSTFLNNKTTHPYSVGNAIINFYNMTLNNNRFYNNIGPGGETLWNSGLSINADNNWWGSNLDGTNPRSAGLTNVAVYNWLVLSVNSSPSTMPSDNASTVTVDLLHDNHGNLVSGLVPDVPVTIQPPSAGSYTPPIPTTLTSGQAQLTFSSENLTRGTVVTVSATVDSQNQQNTIQIDGLVTNTRTNEVFNTIQAAINDIDTITGDTLRLENLTTFNEYNLTIPTRITNLTFDVWNNTHTGPGGYATIDAQNAGRILLINSGVTVTIYNITFTRGSTTDGGAIYNNGTLNVTNCTFLNNSATEHAGAIYNGGHCTVNGSTFTGNTASDGVNNYGGAINNHGNSCILTVDNCTFTNNYATGAAFSGGAIHNYYGISNITNSTFTGNTGTTGGGAIDIYYGTANVTSCTFTNNNGNNHSGSAITNFNGIFTAHFNRFIGNTPNNSQVYSYGQMNATLNWWGTNNNPAGYISGNVFFDPWIILTVTANPTSINYNSSSAITADLVHDSSPAHTYHNPALGHVPDGILVTFPNPSWGNINNIIPPSSNTVNGKVDATYNGNGALPLPIDPVKVYATVDNEQNTYAEVIIIKPTTSTVDNVQGYAGKNVDLVAHVNDNSGRPVPEGDVQFTVNGTFAGSAPVINGVATFNWPVPSDWTTGNYPIFANYMGKPNYAPSSSVGSLYLKPSADVSVTKVVNPGDANTNVGHSFNYTIIAGNNGPDTATGVLITDLIPTDLTYNNYTASQGTYNKNTGIWDVGTLINGASAWINLNVTVKASAAGKTIGNTAYKSWEDQYDPNTGINSNDISTAYIYVPQATVGVNKYTSNTRPNVGEVFYYTIAVNNIGPDTATGVQVTDLLPSTLHFLSVDTHGVGTYNSNTGLWDIGTINSGVTDYLTLYVKPLATAAGKTITNTATKTAQNEYSDNPGVGSVDIYVPLATVGVNKYTSKPTPSVGETFYYTIAVNNIGPDAATGVQVTDLLPSTLQFLSADTHGTGTYNSNTGLWNIGTIPSGLTVYLTLYATPLASAIGTTVTNTATKTAENEYSDNPGVGSVDVQVINSATISQLEAAALIVKTQYEAFGILPVSVLINGEAVSMPQLLYLLATATVNVNVGNLDPIIVISVNPAPSPGGNYTPGNLLKTEYLTLAGKIQTFINTNGRAPNYAATTLGNIPFSKLVYMYSKIINFYGNIVPNRLPNYVTI